MVIFLLLVMLLSFFAANLLAAPGLTNPGSSPSAANEKVDVLVGFPGQPNRELVESAGGEIYREFSIVNVVAASMTPRSAEALGKNPRVSYVEPDGPMYALQVAASSGQDVPWGVDRVFGAQEYPFPTWGDSKGSGVGVAVLDTGIDKNHPDLPELFAGTNTIDDTDFGSDGSGHGTHVAGTIAAQDNSIGVVGVSPQVNLYAVKVLGDDGSGTVGSVVAGIEWAVEQKIPVINMSLGADDSYETLEDACLEAEREGHLLISSAGNSGNVPGRGENVSYPAGYASVLAVAASDSNDNRARFSSTGPEVELIAPGVAIRSTFPDDSYGSASGTSMAAPHVSGTAALVWAADPGLTNKELRTLLQESAEDLGLRAVHQGYGLVRADLAVAAVLDETDPPADTYTLTLEVDPEEAGTVSGGGEYEAGETVSITAAANEGYKFVNWTAPAGSFDNPDAAETTYTMPEQKVTVTANFEAVEDPGNGEIPTEGTVTVSSLEYLTSGGRNQDRHLQVVVSLEDDSGTAVSGASVSLAITLDGSDYDSPTGTTGSDGTVTFNYNNHPSGDYSTAVTAVDAEGLTWDGVTPEDNSYTK